MEPKKHMGGALDKVPGNGHVVGLHERHGTGSIGAWAEWFATAPGRPPWESERPAVKRAKEDSTVPKGRRPNSRSARFFPANRHF